MKNKKDLEIQLSKLQELKPNSVKSEQYQTPSSIAAEILWLAYMNKDIQNKVIADLGCGNGIFGIGSILLGAKKVLFLDSDPKALETAQENSLSLNLQGIFINSDISKFNFKVDTVIMNPPFGTKEKHADRTFLEQAFKVSKTIYSIHKIESTEFIEKFTKDNKFKIIEIRKFKFPIKHSYKFHKKPKVEIEVGCWHLRKL